MPSAQQESCGYNFFKVFWFDSTRGRNAKSIDCKAGALTTTPSRRLKRSFNTVKKLVFHSFSKKLNCAQIYSHSFLEKYQQSRVHPCIVLLFKESCYNFFCLVATFKVERQCARTIDSKAGQISTVFEP